MAVAPSTPNPNQSGQQPSRLNRIARRAHEIYEARGGHDGKDLDDWLRAEREVDEEIDAGSASAEATARQAAPAKAKPGETSTR